MRVLTFTTLFPNQMYPNSAIFIKNRMAAVRNLPDVDVKVVAPVPWFPAFVPGNGRWQQLAKIPTHEQLDGFDVWHPRYLVTPKVGMSLYGRSMYRGSIKTVEELYKQWPFDLIDAHYIYPDSQAALMLGQKLNVPVVVSARGTDMNLYPQIPAIAPLIKNVLSHSQHQIAVSQSLADRMLANGARSDTLTVIPNGIDPTVMCRVDRHLAREKLQLRADAKILLSVGNLVELKGHHILIEALGMLKKQNRLDFETYIIGRGADRNKLQRQIESLELTAQVHLWGEVDNTELKYWYSAADVSFLGSSREGWPNAVCESLACGTPVVATDVNGIPEILTRPDYGLIVKRSADDFAAGVVKALATSWDRDVITAYGQRRTWTAVADEVFNVFDTVITKHRHNNMRKPALGSKGAMHNASGDKT